MAKGKTATCNEPGCDKEVFAKDACRSHYAKRRRASNKKSGPAQAPESAAGAAPTAQASAPGDAPKVSVNEVIALLTSVMLPLAIVVDESFMPCDSAGKPLPHVQAAAAQMLPLLELSLGNLASPEALFVFGCITLISPALIPIIEIAAGGRELRIFRDQPKRRPAPGKTPAADQVVTVTPEGTQA